MHGLKTGELQKLVVKKEMNRLCLTMWIKTLENPKGLKLGLRQPN